VRILSYWRRINIVGVEMKHQFQAADLVTNTSLSNRKIAKIVGLAPNTVGRIRAVIAKKQIGWQQIREMGADEFSRILYVVPQRHSQKRIPDWEYVHKELQKRDVTRSLLWEEYCLVNPDDALSISQFNELYIQYRRKLDLSMRQSHRAGEIVFVDFAGSTIAWKDPETGKQHQAQIFIGVMGCSNFTFAYAVSSQAVADWIQAHVEMFKFFGRAPQIVVPDNLKSAVSRPGREPEINRDYLEMSRHYRVVPIPARVYHPRDKPKAEVGVQFAERWIIARLRKMQFFNLAGINAEITNLLPRLNERPFKRLPGCRHSRYQELDYPSMRDLPAQPYEYAQWTASQKIGPDYHAYIDKHYYSVPHALVQAFFAAER